MRARLDPTANDLAEPPAGEASPALERPSKTKRKAASHDLQALGEALIDMSDEHLSALFLTEPLFDAIRGLRRIRSHEARRRQMQLIGKLMRSADVAPIRAAVAEQELGRARDSLALHQAERWRAELIADDAATTRFASEHPGVDLQQLRSLVRGARKDQSLAVEQRSGRAFRELFQFIRASEVDA
ncbi:MAG: DUF615 domain-containing protein [Pseudomonadota bacterium]|nr:DUF615 domain-containing protein [Pseudomonadota bacterium]